MEFSQDVSYGFENGEANVAYKISEKKGLLSFEGKLSLSPFALLELAAHATKNSYDDKIVEILEGLLANQKALKV